MWATITDIDPVEFTEDRWRESPFAAWMAAAIILIDSAYKKDEFPPKDAAFDDYVEKFSKATKLPAEVIRAEIAQMLDFNPPRGRRL